MPESSKPTAKRPIPPPFPMKFRHFKPAFAACLLMAVPQASHARQSIVEPSPELAGATSSQGPRDHFAVDRPAAEPAVVVHRNAVTLDTRVALRRHPSAVVDLRFLSDDFSGFQPHVLQTSGQATGMAMPAALYSHLHIPRSPVRPNSCFRSLPTQPNS